MDEAKVERMLLWFESQLPPHELGEWRFEAQEHPALLVDETVGMHFISPGSWGQLLGEAYCARCRMRVELPRIGNFSLHAEEEDLRLAVDYPTLTRQAVIDKAKTWMNRMAAQAGPCWGDVPEAPNTSEWAVLDSEIASR
jgi:hypothetical protein